MIGISQAKLNIPEIRSLSYNRGMSDYQTSQSLILRLQQGGDEASWQRFADEYRPFILAIVKGCQLPHEDCEELSQDVLVNVWKAMPDFLYTPERCRFRTWLARVSKNAALSFVKSKKHKQQTREISYELESGDPTFKELSQKSEIDESIEREWQLFITRKAWEKVKVNFNEKTLKAYTMLSEGHHFKDIAKGLQIAEDTVHKYHSRVKDAMSEAIRSLNLDLDI